MRFVALLVLTLTGALPSLAIAADPPTLPRPGTDIMRRVRTHDARLKNALARGAERSPAFRALLQTIESNDVIVYIEMDPRIRGKLSGRMQWVVKTKEARYVRVSINPELSGAHLVSTLAHELQHVAEVGQARTIVDEATLAAFYRHVGTERRSHPGEWDTVAAQEKGDLVRRELAGYSGGLR